MEQRVQTEDKQGWSICRESLPGMIGERVKKERDRATEGQRNGCNQTVRREEGEITQSRNCKGEHPPTSPRTACSITIAGLNNLCIIHFGWVQLVMEHTVQYYVREGKISKGDSIAFHLPRNKREGTSNHWDARSTLGEWEMLDIAGALCSVYEGSNYRLLVLLAIQLF